MNEPLPDDPYSDEEREAFAAERAARDAEALARASPAPELAGEVVDPLPGQERVTADDLLATETLLRLCERTGALLLSEVEPRPPVPRRCGRYDGEGPSVLFGAGGVGKGLLASVDAGRLVDEGERVLLVDYEDHLDEYTRRIQSLHGDWAREGILAVSPLNGRRWRGRTGAIWDIERELRELADAFGATWLVVDSIGPACFGTDMNAPGTPQRYAQAVAHIGRPSISIGQVNRAGDARYPFGSAMWHYLTRASWSIETPPGGIRGTNLLLTDRKANNYAQAERVQVDVDWWEGLPRNANERPYRLVLADRIEAVLAEGAMTAAQVRAELNADVDDGATTTSQATVRETLRRGLKAGRFTVAGLGTTATWSLKP